jgi:hypothetical protein
MAAGHRADDGRAAIAVPQGEDAADLRSGQSTQQAAQPVQLSMGRWMTGALLLRCLGMTMRPPALPSRHSMQGGRPAMACRPRSDFCDLISSVKILLWLPWPLLSPPARPTTQGSLFEGHRSLPGREMVAISRISFEHHEA